MAFRKEEKVNLLDGGSGDSSSYGAIKRDNRFTEKVRRFLCTKRDTVIVSIALTVATCVIVTTLAVGLPRIKENERLYFDTTFASSPSHLVSYKKAAVIADGSECAKIGRDVLSRNGTAVDAAIATLFCNGVVTPQSMGIGGGFFMIVYINQSKKSEVIDAREVAPIAATQDMFHGNRSLSLEGGLSIAVPGELSGYWFAHQKYGNMDWGDLIQPSIDICKRGFKVTSHLADKIELLRNQIMEIPSMKEMFFNNETGQLFKEGELIKRPQLGRTLALIAEKGYDVLYTGELSEGFIQDIENCGGIISKYDLQQYQPETRDPVKISLKSGGLNKTLLTMPPPGSGLVLSLILQLLQGYNITAESISDVDDAVLTYHRLIETFKFGFAYRTKLADPKFVNLDQLVENLENKEFVDSIRKQISDVKTFTPDYYKPLQGADIDYGTSHVSVMAPNGDAVSATSSVNTYFGSLCLSPSTGIILNNEMDGFTSPNITNYFSEMPSSRNFIEPGKRPISSMTPSILINENDDVEMITGGMGGTRIITALAQDIMRILWLRQDVKAAADAPRLHHQLMPNYVQYEEGFPRIYLDRLKGYGHEVQEDHEGSQVLTILKSNGQIMTNVDYRKNGSTAGF